MRNKLIKYPLALLIIFTALTAVCEEASARAGGGGGHSGGGGSHSHYHGSGGYGPRTIVDDIMGYLFLGAFGSIGLFLGLEAYNLNRLLKQKSAEARKMLDRIRSSDPAWDPEHIRDRVRKVYFNIQRAWMARNQDLAKEFMSGKLYATHKMMTDAMIARHEKNILDEIELLDSQAVSVEDHTGDDRDILWVYITGLMIDYKINDMTGYTISGDRSKKEKFNELWKFIKNAEGEWILDEIKNKVNSSEFNNFKAVSEY